MQLYETSVRHAFKTQKMEITWIYTNRQAYKKNEFLPGNGR